MDVVYSDSADIESDDNLTVYCSDNNCRAGNDIHNSSCELCGKDIKPKRNKGEVIND